MSEANLEIANAARVDIYGIKGEGNIPVLWMKDSYDINIYGFGGTLSSFPNETYYPGDFEKYTSTLFRIERSVNYTFANLICSERKKPGTQKMTIFFDQF